jgi:hypothetical protein
MADDPDAVLEAKLFADAGTKQGYRTGQAFIASASASTSVDPLVNRRSSYIRHSEKWNAVIHIGRRKMRAIDNLSMTVEAG